MKMINADVPEQLKNRSADSIYIFHPNPVSVFSTTMNCHCKYRDPLLH